MSDPAALVRFYDALAALGPLQRLGELELRKLPQRGVYFFFEDGEERRDSGTGPPARRARCGRCAPCAAPIIRYDATHMVTLLGGGSL